MFRLTRCRRCDQLHFDFYTGLPRKLSEAIATSQSRYGQADDADLHVCISHRRRRAIAHAKQKRLEEGKECVEIPEGDDPAFSCFAGTKLAGNSSAGKVVNGGRYTVTKATGDKATLKDDLEEETFEISLDANAACSLMPWCTTRSKEPLKTAL